MKWRNDLYQFETPPPAQLWNEIAQELQGEPISLGQRLRDHEVPPPPSTWANVSKALNEPAQVRRIPMWQYAAAAAVVIGTALGIYYISPDKGSPIGAEQVATSLIPKDSPIGNAASSNVTITPVVSPSEKVADIAKTDPGHPHTFKEYHAPGIQVSYTDGNYIKLRAPDGKDHRVSYKCAVLIPCLAKGSKSGDKVPCAEDLDNWKKKLGESGFIPAGDNFFDIAGFASMLESTK